MCEVGEGGEGLRGSFPGISPHDASRASEKGSATSWLHVLAVSQSVSQSDRQTNRQTDRQTDSRSLSLVRVCHWANLYLWGVVER